MVNNSGGRCVESKDDVEAKSARVYPIPLQAKTSSLSSINKTSCVENEKLRKHHRWLGDVRWEMQSMLSLGAVCVFHLQVAVLQHVLWHMISEQWKTPPQLRHHPH
jgi:hypothetical protein